MVKKLFLVGVMLLMSLMVVGCGIPQEQHDVVVADLDKAQAELESLKAELKSVGGELEVSESKVSELTSSLGKTETELESTKSEYGAFKSDVEEALLQLALSSSLCVQLFGIANGIILDQPDEIPTIAANIEPVLYELNDDVLTGYWEEAYTEEGEQWQLFFEPFSELCALSMLRYAGDLATVSQFLVE